MALARRSLGLLFALAHGVRCRESRDDSQLRCRWQTPLIAAGLFALCTTAASCLPEAEVGQQEMVLAPTSPCRTFTGATTPLTAPSRETVAETVLAIETGVDVPSEATTDFSTQIRELNAFFANDLAVPPYLRVRLCAEETSLGVTAFDPVPQILTGLQAAPAVTGVSPTAPRALNAQRYGQVVFVINGIRLDEDWSRVVAQSYRLAEVSALCATIEQRRSEITNASQREAVDQTLAAYRGERDYLDQLLQGSPWRKLAHRYLTLFADTLAVLAADDGAALANELEPFGAAVVAEARGFADHAAAYHRAIVEARDFTRDHTAVEIESLPEALRSARTLSAPTRTFLWHTYAEMHDDTGARGKILNALLEASFARLQADVVAASADPSLLSKLPALPEFNDALIAAVRDRLPPD